MKELIKKMVEANEKSHWPSQTPMAKALRDMYAQVATEHFANQWIKVEDRLPEKEVKYLVYRRERNEIIQALYQDDGNFYCGVVLGQITHWMPLPEPPKQ